MARDPTEDLFKTIDARREELVELTRELIRFPTVNPPGEGYRPCAQFIGERLRSRGFAVDYVHAVGTPGGRTAQFICSPGTYDQKHIDRIGKLRDCIAYGPGILDLAHQPDEYVGIDDMVNSAKVMALAAHSLLHGTA
jgi:acetylornithine deacetylase/succinyl-diaminopimelate desuccinylase-like protein